MIAYYAHCTSIYDTEQERRDLLLIETLGIKCFNPNCPECTIGYKKHGMDFFKPFINQFDVVFFRSLPDGKIPAGVFKEINWANEADIPVIELPSGISRRSLTVEQTREYLKECGFR